MVKHNELTYYYCYYYFRCYLLNCVDSFAVDRRFVYRDSVLADYLRSMVEMLLLLLLLLFDL